jgi:hypothetical protein
VRALSVRALSVRALSVRALSVRALSVRAVNVTGQVFDQRRVIPAAEEAISQRWMIVG